jgi:hypothetical protein
MLIPFFEELSSARTKSQSKRVFNSEDLVDGVLRHVCNGCFPFSTIHQCRGFDYEEAHIFHSHVALVRRRV